MRLPVAPWLGLMLAVRGPVRGGPGLVGTTLGIAMSLVPVIVVLVVADGMIEGITARFLEVDTYHARIELPVSNGSVEELVSSARALSGVELAEMELRSGGRVVIAGRRGAVQMRVVNPGLLERDPGLRRYLSMEGSFDLRQDDRVVIGREIADKLGVNVGDSVGLWGSGARRVVPAKIVGVYRSGYQQLDGAFAFIAESMSVTLGATGSRFVGIKVQDPFRDLEWLLASLGTLMPEEARLRGWYELQSAVYRSFRDTRTWLILIMAVIALVATINIASALRMLLLERSAEMAYMRAIGASGDQVGLAFLTVGLISGASGSVIGVAVGLAAAINVNELLTGLELVVNEVALLLSDNDTSTRLIDRSFYLEQIPVRADIGQLVIAGTMAILAAAIAAVWPALQAAHLQPIEELQQR